MKKIVLLGKCLLTIAIIGTLVRCASTGSPSGGPRDTKPPDLVVDKSDLNFSTQFRPQKIELVFDEWIELRSQQKEILISPPFFKNPKISSRGKKVTVEFPESEPLRPDATYTINFGKSIVDFTEGNAAEGFRFVFSTGDKIDSLTFSGSIVDAFEGKPVKDVLVLLYDVLGDSVVVNEKPFYYARSDDKGNFGFENLKNDTFKLLVLEDLNFNYLLDDELEKLAFPDSLFYLTDSAMYAPKLRLFKPEQRVRVLDSSSETPGLVYTQFNKSAEEVDFEILYPSDFEPIVERSKDTLLFWYTESIDSVGLIYNKDTLDFTLKPFDSLFYAKKVKMLQHNAEKAILAPFDSLTIMWNAPIMAIDTSLMSLSDKPLPPPKPTIVKDSMNVDSLGMSPDSLSLDSLVVPTDTLTAKDEDDTIFPEIDTSGTAGMELLDSLVTKKDSIGAPFDSMQIPMVEEYGFKVNLSLRNTYIKRKWKEDHAYRLEILPGAITDIYGRSNDTLIIDFKTARVDQFGNITLNVSGLDSNQQYVVVLKLKDKVIRKSVLTDTQQKKLAYRQLRVNTYAVELIKDDDRNTQWTTGDYWKKRQPEEVKFFELEKLRENWDLEADIYWNEPLVSGADSTSVGLDSLFRDRGNRNVVPDSLKIKKDGLNLGRKLPLNKRNNKKENRSNGAGILPDPNGKNN